MTTEIVVLRTALDALAAGLAVQVLVDATTPTRRQVIAALHGLT
ncbi:hypothetical protein [Nonomuraea jabiensis]